MKKNRTKTVRMTAILLGTCLFLGACQNRPAQTSENQTRMREQTEPDTGSESITEEQQTTTEEFRVKLVRQLEESESETERATEPETETESESEPESDGTKEPETEEPTDTPVPTKAPTAAPNPTATPKPTAKPKPTSTPVPTKAPTAAPKPTATPKPTAKPKPTNTPVPVTATGLTASVSGNHYIGDTLTAAEFTIRVTMSDGTTLTNPGGWSASPLTLTKASNVITVSYGNLQTKITVKASARPTQAPKPTNTPKPSPTQPDASDSRYTSDDIYNRTYSGTPSLEMSQAVFDLINADLKAQGLAPMQWNNDAFIRGILWCKNYTFVEHEDQFPAGNVCGGSGAVSPTDVFNLWKNSLGHYNELKHNAGNPSAAVSFFRKAGGGWICCMCYGSENSITAEDSGFSPLNNFHGPMVNDGIQNGTIPRECLVLERDGTPSLTKNGYYIISYKNAYIYIYSKLLVPYIPGLSDGTQTYAQWRAAQGYSYY